MSFPHFLLLFFLIPIPIIFHFISKRFLRTKDFPSLLFVLKSDRKLLRWFRLRRLLLLLLRIGIITSLIFAASNLLIPFAFPDLDRKVILDQSLSMRERNISHKSCVVVPNKGGTPLIYKAVRIYPMGILVTDAQRNGFKELFIKGDRYPGIDLEKIPMPDGNIGIIDHQIGSPFRGDKVDILFTILNQYKDSRNIRLSLYIDNSELDKKNLLLHTGTNEVKFSIHLKEGSHSGALMVDDEDGFEFDNIRYFTLFVLPVTKIVIYSTRYPEKLLAALHSPSFQVKWIKEQPGKIEGDIFISECICLDAISKIVKDSIPGIICISGRDKCPYAMEIPDRISKIANLSGFSSFSELQSLSDIPIRYDCRPTPGRTLLYFENGDPFLKRTGNVLLLPVTMEESDLSLHPVFIPFLYELIAYLLKGDYDNDILMDEPVVIKASSEPVVITPNNKRYKPTSIGDNRYLFTQTGKPGIYRVSPGTSEERCISVNPYPSESMLDTLKAQESANLFGRGNYHNGATFFLVMSFLLYSLSIVLERK